MSTNKYVGKIFPVLNGYNVKVIDYKNNKNIMVKFQDEFKAIKKTNLGNLLTGKIKNPYLKSVYKIGRIGNIKNVNNNVLYQRWKQMISRCYNEKDPVYNIYGGNGVIVSDEWLIFENYQKDIKQMENFDNFQKRLAYR